jgi:hypothetical protein
MAPSARQPTPTKRQIAAELVNAWSAGWPLLSSDSLCEETRGECLLLARRLVDFGSRGDFAHGGPEVTMALTTIREIGEGCALMSEMWPLDGEDVPPLPLRHLLAAVASNTGLPKWCASHGCYLDLDVHPEDMGLTMGMSFDTMESQPSDVSDAAIASLFLHELERYEDVRALRRIWAPDLDWAAMTRSTVADLSAIRYRRYWALTARRGDLGAQVALRLAALLTDMRFMIASEGGHRLRPPDADVPVAEFWRLLRATGMGPILESVGVEMPAQPDAPKSASWVRRRLRR